MSSVSKTLYLETKPSRLFVKAAIPGGISMVVSSLYAVFESIFVGKFVGTTAFAALGLAFPLVVINFALSDLIGVGSSVPISILLGKKEDDKANNYFTCAAIMIFLTGLIMGTLIYFIAPLFMHFMGAEGELADLGVQYARIYAVFSPFITMTFAVDNFLRISGKIKTSMFFNIFASIGTVILELIFIVICDMGIVGAALGSSLAMLIMVIAGISMFVGKKLQLKFVKPHFERGMVFEILKNGSPAFLSNVAGRVFSIVMNIMLLSAGGEAAVAVYGVLMTIGCVAEMIVYGILDALQPAIGYNYGAKKYERVKTIEKYCLCTSAIISFLSALIIFLIPQYLAIPFLEDLSLLDLSVHALRLFSFTYIFKWIGSAISNFLLALEKPFPATCVSLASVCVFPLILALVLYPFGLDGLWLNYPLTAVCTAVMSIFIILKLRKRLFAEAKET